MASELNTVLKLAALRQQARLQPSGGGAEHPFKTLIGGSSALFLDTVQYGIQAGDFRNYELPRTKWGAALAATLLVSTYRCSELRARRIGSLDWCIRDSDTKTVLARSTESRPNHPLAAAIKDYERLTGYGFFYHWEWNSCLFGENYIDLIVNEFGFPTGTYIINPLYIQPNIIGGRIRDFTYAGEAKMEVFQPFEIAYWKAFNPLDLHRGYSPALVAIDEMNISRDFKRYLKAYYINNALPGIAVAPPEDRQWDGPQMMQIKNVLQRLRGVENSFKALIVPEPAQFTEFDQPELSNDILMHEAMERIVHKAFGVPLAMAGDTNATTFKDGEEAQDFMNQNTIVPEGDMIAGSVSSSILPGFIDPFSMPPNQEFAFETSQFERLSEETQRRYATAVSGFGGNILTLNQARELVNEKPDARPMGNQYFFEIQEQYSSSAPASLMIQHSPAAGVGPGTGSEPGKLPAPRQEPPTLNRRSLGDASALFMLGYEPALVGLQYELKAIYGEKFQATPWDQMHVTLCQAAAVSPLALANVHHQLSFAPVTLQTDGLGEFITPRERTVHVKIAKSPELAALHQGLFDSFNNQNIAVSEHCWPRSWQPHVTLGTLSANAPGLPRMACPELSMEMGAVHFCRDNFNVVTFVPAARAVLWEDLQAYAHSHHVKRLEWSEEAARAEIAKWRRHSGRHQRTFEPNVLRGDLGDYITAQLEAAHGERALELDVFREAERLVSEKSISEQEAQFKAEFSDVTASLNRGEISRREAGPRLRGLIDRFFTPVYLSGLADGGVKLERSELEPEEVADLKALRAQSRGYISDLTAAITEGRVSDAQMALKPESWWARIMMPVYQSGLQSADGNGLYTFEGDDGERTCRTCQYCKGRRHRLSTWIRAKLNPPAGDNIICSPGGHCQHGLSGVRGKATQGGLTGAPVRISLA